MLSVFYLISAPRIWRHHALCDWEFDEDNGVFVEAVWRRRDAARHLLSPSAALMTDGQWLKMMIPRCSGYSGDGLIPVNPVVFFLTSFG